MKQRKNDERKVYQSFAMVMQFGLNMIVPICMMSALGVWLDKRFGTSWITILFFVIGAVAGGQNVYRMTMRMFGTDESERERVFDEDDRGGEENE
ncbi:MAG: AtpZ/AtpI family protein [Lachnospiraceae bacterium]|nr:AtpZ/AtpI family protein [Lachnospiraceae bacterium]